MNYPDGSIDPFAGRNFRWLLDHCVAEYADREALVWRDLDGGRMSWTYRELVGAADTFASHLRARGIRRGDRVGVHMANQPEFVIAWFALSAMGAVTVSTNSRLTAPELEAQLRRTTAKMVITSGELLDTVRAAVSTLTHRAEVVVTDLSETPGELDEGVARFSSLLAPVPSSLPEEEPEVVSSSDLAEIQFTSGTTGQPKGVMWSQANLLWAAKVSADHAGMADGERVLLYLPLFHTNAQTYSALPALWVGGCLVLMPRFSGRQFWPVSVEERATYCSMIPFAVRALLKQEVPADHAYRLWCSGIFVRHWDRYFGIPTCAWYGMTETVSQPVTSEAGWPGRHLAMGRPAAEYQVRVVEDGKPLRGPGQGVLEVRGVPGVSLAMGYLDDPEATDASRTADGWFKTGDRVELHPDGWLTFVERDGDMLKVGGENVAAAEIEQAIGRVPGVDEVAVVALRDRMLDEVPVAFALARTSDPDDLVERILEHCRSNLADFKVPRHVWVVDELPRATLEKVSKVTLRQLAETLAKA